jgi:hypothetical protein
MRLTESLDRVANYTLERDHPFYRYKFSMEPELNITVRVKIEHMDDSHITVAFGVYGYDESTIEKTKSNFTIFSTIAEIVKNHVEKYDIDIIHCGTNEHKKLAIYEKLFERFGPEWRIERFDEDIFAKRK